LTATHCLDKLHRSSLTGRIIEEEALRMADRPSSPRPRWRLVLVVVAAIALVGLMVFLHLTGTLEPGLH